MNNLNEEIAKVKKGCISFNIDKKREVRCKENPENRLCYECQATLNALTLAKKIEEEKVKKLKEAMINYGAPIKWRKIFDREVDKIFFGDEK